MQRKKHSKIRLKTRYSQVNKVQAVDAKIKEAITQKQLEFFKADKKEKE